MCVCIIGGVKESLPVCACALAQRGDGAAATVDTSAGTSVIDWPSRTGRSLSFFLSLPPSFTIDSDAITIIASVSIKSYLTQTRIASLVLSGGLQPPQLRQTDRPPACLHACICHLV
eukprot:GHVU01227561.1.p1 GENE.GHVU01227561.1~~GHVU01227561.1.p1  ORF type:complete len:117 (-),score=7.84 GHVU01227561.1:37-387(-)